MVRWADVWSLIRALRSHVRLLAAVIVVSIIGASLYYVAVDRTYTAVAVVGPPGPSPTGAIMAAGGAPSLSVSRMLSGNAPATKDNYQDFLQLLPSSRLSQVLIDRDQITRRLFPARWDQQNHRWKSPGPMRSQVLKVKEALGLPHNDVPGPDAVTDYLQARLKVSQSNNSSTSTGLLARSTPYVQISLTADNPEEAENLLRTILAETDRIVREDQGRDISARITFLRNELASQGLSVDERAALISILSGQEQLLAMVQADQRFASNLIVPPFASLRPTTPPGLVKVMAGAMFLAFALWVGLVLLSQWSLGVRRMIAWARTGHVETASVRLQEAD